jgi:hypothetical protein
MFKQGLYRTLLLRSQSSHELRYQRLTAASLVVHIDLHAVCGECLAHLVHATPGQGDMMRMQFRSGNDTRLIKSRQAQRLGLAICSR